MISALNRFPLTAQRNMMEQNARLRKQIKRLKRELKDERGLCSDIFEMYIQDVAARD